MSSATKIGQLQTCRPLKMTMPLHYTGIIKTTRDEKRKGDIGYILTYRIILIVAANKLIQDDVKFQSFYRMSKESFNLLVEKVGPEIEKQDTHFRRCICVRERLLITLR